MYCSTRRRKDCYDSSPEELLDPNEIFTIPSHLSKTSKYQQALRGYTGFIPHTVPATISDYETDREASPGAGSGSGSGGGSENYNERLSPSYRRVMIRGYSGHLHQTSDVCGRPLIPSVDQQKQQLVRQQDERSHSGYGDDDFGREEEEKVPQGRPSSASHFPSPTSHHQRRPVINTSSPSLSPSPTNRPSSPSPFSSHLPPSVQHHNTHPAATPPISPLFRPNSATSSRGGGGGTGGTGAVSGGASAAVSASGAAPHHGSPLHLSSSADLSHKKIEQSFLGSSFTNFRTYGQHMELEERYSNAIQKLYHRHQQTQPMLLRLIQSKLSEHVHSFSHQYCRSKKIFEYFDLDGSGTLDELEFKQFLELQNCYLNDIQSLALFAYFDVTKTGGITWEQFERHAMVSNPQGGTGVIPKAIIANNKSNEWKSVSRVVERQRRK
jgi:hypothetical protein